RTRGSRGERDRRLQEQGPGHSQKDGRFGDEDGEREPARGTKPERVQREHAERHGRGNGDESAGRLGEEHLEERDEEKQRDRRPEQVQEAERPTRDEPHREREFRPDQRVRAARLGVASGHPSEADAGQQHRERAEYHADPGVSPSFQREEREDRREAERRRDERGPGSQELDLPETTQGSIGGRTARGNIGGSGWEGGRALRHWPFPEPAGLKRLSLHAGGSERGGPEGLVLGPRDDVVLQGTGQVA